MKDGNDIKITHSDRTDRSNGSDNNYSNKSVTHTDHRSKTESNKAPSSKNTREV